MPLAVLLFLLTPLSACAACCAVSERRFEAFLPSAMIALVLLLLFFGLAGALLAGVWAALLIAAGLWLYTAVRLKRERGFRAFARRFFTPGFGLFVFLAAALLFFNYGRMIGLWDDFTHWGDVVWVMSTLDDFATAPQAFALYPEYPPGISLFQYFLEKLLLLFSPGGGVREWAMYYAHQLFFFSLFLPFAEKLDFRRPYAFILIACVFLCPLFLDPHDMWLQQLTVDTFLAVPYACALALILTTREKTAFDYVQIGLLLAFSALFKGLGLPLALLGGAVLLWMELGPGEPRRRLLPCLLAAGLPLIPRLLWEGHVALSGVSKAFPVRAGLEGGLWGPESYRLECLKRYVQAFLTKNVASGSLPVVLTPVLLLALVSTLLYLLLRVYSRRFPERQRTYGRFFLAVFAAMLVCLASICLAYMFTFTQREALSLASFSRYTGTVFLSGLYLALLLAIDLTGRGLLDGSRFAALAFCVQAALTPWGQVLDYVDRGGAHYSAQLRQETYESIIDKVHSLTEEAPGRFYILSEYEMDNVTLRYLLRPNSTNIDNSFQTEQTWNTYGIPYGYEGEQDPAAAWCRDLRENYDYVLIFNLNEQIREGFAASFEDPEEIRGSSIYRVDPDTGRLSLCE